MNAPIPTIQLLLTAALLLFCSSAGVSGVVAKKPPLFWPNTRLIPVQIGYETKFMDGLEFEITKFENSAIPLYTTSMRSWQRSSKLTFRNASVAFVNSKNPAIKLGLSIVRTQDWLRDVNHEALTLYVASLRNLNQDRFTWLNQDTDFQPIANSDYICGSPYKIVRYQIAPKVEGQEVVEIVDFIAEYKEFTLVFSFESPQSLASRNLDNAMTTLFSLSPESDFR